MSIWSRLGKLASSTIKISRSSRRSMARIFFKRPKEGAPNPKTKNQHYANDHFLHLFAIYP